jgi:hypothetical protein
MHLLRLLEVPKNLQTARQLHSLQRYALNLPSKLALESPMVTFQYNLPGLHLSSCPYPIILRKNHATTPPWGPTDRRTYLRRNHSSVLQTCLWFPRSPKGNSKEFMHSCSMTESSGGRRCLDHCHDIRHRAEGNI